ncbi:hypothetical protein [Paraburkholderia azotifigens]|uniref:Uncharacterized protein n=1 Tax=Paraburkholderia azotifigens TaxID=2057004 RepID=A0ABU9REE2_9BURK|nr:hypothetical protein [Paraburkholderia azotifigens]
MSRIETERQTLALTDHHIAQARQLIQAQEASIMKMQEIAIDTCQAEELLSLMQAVLFSFEQHRALIEASISRLQKHEA